MGRIIAIAGGDLTTTKKINEYAVNMLKGDTRNILFIGTASGDANSYIDSITIEFEQLGCSVKALCLATKEYIKSEIEELISWADIIYVGGGDTIFMMDKWKKYGVDIMLKSVYEKDLAVLMGISAGAICWFNCGCTDSELAEIKEGCTYGWAEGMLDIHKYAYCPHYEERVEDFALLMKEENISGLAMENDTAFVEENGNVYYIKTNPLAKVYTIKNVDGEIKREEIEVRLI